MRNGKGLSIALAFGLMLGLSADSAAQSVDRDSKNKDKDRARVFFTQFPGGKRFGVVIEDSRTADGAKTGVKVREVVKGSAAEKAGISAGDLITSINGKQIDSSSDLRRSIRELDYGKQASIGVLRNGAPMQMSFTLEKDSENRFYYYGWGSGESKEAYEKAMEEFRRAFEKAESEWKNRKEGDKDYAKSLDQYRKALEELEKAKGVWRIRPRVGQLGLFSGRGRLGIYPQELTEQLRQHFGVEKDRGVLIASVVENSPAAKVGLKAGDCIVEVNGNPISNHGDLMRELRKIESGEVRITVVRDRQRIELRPVIEPRSENEFNFDFESPGAVVIEPFELTGLNINPETIVIPKIAVSKIGLEKLKYKLPKIKIPEIDLKALELDLKLLEVY